MRVHYLEKLLLMLFTAENCIAYLAVPSDELITRLAENSELADLKFLKVCNDYMNNGKDFKTSWKASLNVKSNTRLLADGDIDILMSFGEVFGTTDKSGQLANCQIHKELLNERLENARASCKSYSSLSAGMGIVCGIGTVIILI